MKIGTFLLHIVKLQELCQMNALDEALKHPAIQGISCVDGDTKVYDRLDLREAKHVLDDHGIQTSSVYHVACCDEIIGAGREQLKDDLKFQLDRCAIVETKMMMPVPECSTEIGFPERRKLMMEYFCTAAELAEPYGIQVVMENYSRAESTFATVADVGCYLDQIPQLGYVLDTGNFWFTHSDVLEACEKYLSRIVHVHIKDMKNIKDNPPRVFEGRGFDSVAIGDGDTPIEAIIERLKQIHYSGALSIEISSPVQLVEKLAGSIRYLNNWTR